MRILLALLLLCLVSCAATGNPKEGKHIKSIYIGQQLTGWVWDISGSYGQQLDIYISLTEITSSNAPIHLKVTGGELMIEWPPDGDAPPDPPLFRGTELEIPQGLKITWWLPTTDSELMLYVTVEDETREIPVSVTEPTIPG